jgi:hypothetical protein
VKATIEGLDIVVKGLEQQTLEVREGAFQGVLLAMNAAFKACETLITADDHSLRELARMGHPYGFTNPQEIHDPDVVIHMQSGKYAKALHRDSPRGAFGEIIEGRIDMSGDPKMAQLDRWLQEGTTLMRERPWMQWIVDHYGEDFAKIIEASIRRAIRGAS